MTETVDLSGQNLGDYKLTRHIARGGMADVYLGTKLFSSQFQRDLERHFAVKVLFGTTEEAARRFEKEMAILLRLNHTNIVRVHDYAVVDGQHYGLQRAFRYFVMDYLAGGTLFDRIVQDQMSIRELLDILRVVANALDFAHSEGIIHRDIKPSNVLFDKAGNPVLADFGISKLDSRMHQTRDLTTEGFMLGTPPYLAPETFRNEQIDRRADLYSFGVMTYYALSGKLPFEGRSTEALLAQILFSDSRTLSVVNPTIPRRASEAVTRMIAKNPADRFDTASDFIRALEREFSGVAVETMKIPPPDASHPADTPFVYQTNSPDRGHWTLRLGLLLTVLTVVLVVVGLAVQYGQRNEPSGPSSSDLTGTAAALVVIEQDTPEPSVVAVSETPGNTLPEATASSVVVETASPETSTPEGEQTAIEPAATEPQEVTSTLTTDAASPVPDATEHAEPGEVSGTPDGEAVVASVVELSVGYMEPVTNDQYRACVASGACAIVPAYPGIFKDRGQGKSPVVGISWHAANAYCLAMGGRLPSVAEWELMVRGGIVPVATVREWTIDDDALLETPDVIGAHEEMPVRDMQSPDRALSKEADSFGTDIGFRCVVE